MTQKKRSISLDQDENGRDRENKMDRDDIRSTTGEFHRSRDRGNHNKGQKGSRGGAGKNSGSPTKSKSTKG